MLRIVGLVGLGLAWPALWLAVKFDERYGDL